MFRLHETAGTAHDQTTSEQGRAQRTDVYIGRNSVENSDGSSEKKYGKKGDPTRGQDKHWGKAEGERDGNVTRYEALQIDRSPRATWPRWPLGHAKDYD